MKQNSFDPAKHRRVRADSEGKTKNRKKRKSRIAPQHPQTETKILSDLIWPHPPLLLASQFLHLFDAAKLPKGRGACFHRRHTGRKFSVDQRIEVMLHFLSHFRIAPFLSKRAEKTRGGCADCFHVSSPGKDEVDAPG